MNILHISPHPDDECIGAGATLISLAKAGHRIINLAVSLGKNGQEQRRGQELRAACKTAGFELELPKSLHLISAKDDLVVAESTIATEVEQLALDKEIALLIAPSVHDGHHGHEVVGRAAARAAQRLGLPLWMWGLWSELPVPTILHGFDKDILNTALAALACHVGELARNDYRHLVEGRAKANAVLAPERIFGFGSPGISQAYAEVLCEVHPLDGRWLLGKPQRLDVKSPIGKAVLSDDITEIMQAPSARAHLAQSRRRYFAK